MKKLTKKDLLFAGELADRIDPKSAAMVVYGGDKLDEKVKDAYELIRRPEFQDALTREQKNRDFTYQVKKYHLVKRLVELMDGDTDFLEDEDGYHKPLNQMTRAERFLVKRTRVKGERVNKCGDTVPNLEHETYDRSVMISKLAELCNLKSAETIIIEDNREVVMQEIQDVLNQTRDRLGLDT